MKTIILLSMIFLVAVLPASGQGNLGQAGANFLQIGADPRGAALGGAVTALSQGAAALYWNPAGAVDAKNVSIALANTRWFLDTRLMYAGVVKNMGGLGTIGLSATSFYMEPQEITTVYESEGTGRFYNAGDLAVGLSYARALTDRFAFGATVKYVREYIWTETASQLAFDVGSVYRTDFYNLRLGMSVRNFSGKLKFSGEQLDQRLAEELARNQPKNPRAERLTPEFRLPQVFQLGIAFDPYVCETQRVTVLFDVETPSDNRERLLLGAEYAFRELAFLRGGYRFGDDLAGPALGGGLQLAITGVNAFLDYAYTGRGVLGNVHQFGLGLNF